MKRVESHCRPISDQPYWSPNGRLTGGNEPVSLARFLETDGDLGQFRYINCLARAVLVERRRQSPGERRLLAQWCRERVSAWVSGRTAWDDGVALPRDPEYVTALLWQAECLEQPVLAQRFKEGLPHELLRECEATAFRPEALLTSSDGSRILQTAS